VRQLGRRVLKTRLAGGVGSVAGGVKPAGQGPLAMIGAF
jgi:hypothetical protein